MKPINSKHLSVVWFAALAMFACMLGAGQVAADPSDNPPTVAVNYADLDLSKPEGAAVLYGRLEHAARQVCGNIDGRRLEQVAHWEACYQRALREAVGAVDKPTLTTYHNARQGIRTETVEPTVARTR
jgi:UrcA family protein